MTTGELITLCVGLAELIGTGVAWFTLYGRVQQKVDDVKEDVKDLKGRVDVTERDIQSVSAAAQDIRSSVEMVASKIDGQRQLWDLQIKGITDQVKAGQDLLQTKLEGFERLATNELGQVKHDVRGVKQDIAGLPHPRRRTPTDH